MNQQSTNNFLNTDLSLNRLELIIVDVPQKLSGLIKTEVSVMASVHVGRIHSIHTNSLVVQEM